MLHRNKCRNGPTKGKKSQEQVSCRRRRRRCNHSGSWILREEEEKKKTTRSRVENTNQESILKQQELV